MVAIRLIIILASVRYIRLRLAEKIGCLVKASANLYSLIETAKAHQLYVLEYLQHIFKSRQMPKQLTKLKHFYLGMFGWARMLFY